MPAPEMPGHTCPIIDKIKDSIIKAHKLADRVPNHYESEDLKELLSNIEHELWGCADKLEEIRHANSQLRSCAEHYKQEYEDLWADYRELRESYG